MNRLTFKSKKELIEFLFSTKDIRKSNDGKSFFPAGTYYLNHGEYSQPDLIPRRYKDGWGIHIRYYYHEGTLKTPKDGRIDIDAI